MEHPLTSGTASASNLPLKILREKEKDKYIMINMYKTKLSELIPVNLLPNKYAVHFQCSRLAGTTSVFLALFEQERKQTPNFRSVSAGKSPKENSKNDGSAENRAYKGKLNKLHLLNLKKKRQSVT